MEECRERLTLGPKSPYFNAGVICFDWSATVGSGLLQRAQTFAMENAHLCKSYDQDALNKAFVGAWVPLDPRWEFMTVAVPDDVIPLHYPARLQPYIAHFAGPTKPWAGNFPIRFQNHCVWYWDLLRDLPWPHFAVPPNSATQFHAIADRLEEWVMTWRRWCKRAMKLHSSAKGKAPRRRQNAKRRGFSLSPSSQKNGANFELVYLFDQMIAEANGSIELDLSIW